MLSKIDYSNSFSSNRGHFSFFLVPDQINNFEEIDFRWWYYAGIPKFHKCKNAQMQIAANANCFLAFGREK